MTMNTGGSGVDKQTSRTLYTFSGSNEVSAGKAKKVPKASLPAEVGSGAEEEGEVPGASHVAAIKLSTQS